MRKLILSIVLLSGCTVQVKPDAESQIAMKQHAIIIEQLVNYIAALQASGDLPKPDAIKQEKK